jgi:hypothetical protein
MQKMKKNAANQNMQENRICRNAETEKNTEAESAENAEK